MAACSSWARRRPAYSSRPRSGARGGRSSWRSESTSAYRARTAAATFCGGWMHRAFGISATMRWRTSREPDVCRRRSSSGRPNALIASGVELVGRWASIRDGVALFSGGLRNVCALADLKMNRLLDGFDEWAETSGTDAEGAPTERFAQTERSEEH